MRRRWLLVWSICWGCEPDLGAAVEDAYVDPVVEVGADYDASPSLEVDAAVVPTTLDAALPRDAASAEAADFEVGERDARPLNPPADASLNLDAEWPLDEGLEDMEPPEMEWGPCAVSGTPGECLHVDDCAPPAAPTPGLCPGPAEIQCCATLPDEPDPPGGCDPAAHPTPHAGLAEAAGEGPCPPGMAWVRPAGAASYCIDRYEAALLEVFDDGGEAPWSPYHNPGDREVRAVSIEGAVPQGYIDGAQSARACEASGKRLCSDAEWLRACRGAQDWVYPYGPDRAPGVCNDARARHPAVELFPNDPNPFDRIQHACINQLPDGLAPSGSYEGCVTAEGVHDLMGNLHEWTSDPTGTFRGGFYVDTVRNGPGCLYRTTAHNRFHWDYSTGFRCCADAD